VAITDEIIGVSQFLGPMSRMPPKSTPMCVTVCLRMWYVWRHAWIYVCKLHLCVCKHENCICVYICAWKYKFENFT